MINKKFVKLFLVLVSYLAVYSCVPRKDFVYLQNNNSTDTLSQKLNFNKYKLKPGDVLIVTVSGIKEGTYEFFNKVNPELIRGLSEDVAYLQGYSIDKDGNINLPLIGYVPIKGLTIDETITLLQDKINQYIFNAVVDVTLVSFRVTILGEINSPGEVFFYNDRVNLLQLIGRSGGLTELGNRKRIRLMRTKNDTIVTYFMDLTDKDIVSREEFFLQPNDIIYVEPLKARPNRSNFPAIQFMLSVTTASLLLITFFFRFSD